MDVGEVVVAASAEVVDEEALRQLRTKMPTVNRANRMSWCWRRAMWKRPLVLKVY